MINLRDHQRQAINQLKTGSILQGGVGSGKSRTAIAYFYSKECEGGISDTGEFSEMQKPKDLYIITTVKKRDALDWERECASFMLSRDRTASINGVQVVVDSWNKIGKYVKVENAFFIFDEQRLVGSGSWVRSFLKIAKHNNWILLSATPGDTWLDYIPVFVANGFYPNRTEFKKRHVVYNNFAKFPKVDHYVEEGRLIRLQRYITVIMTYDKPTKISWENIVVDYDKTTYDIAAISRWNPYSNLPIKDIGEYCFTLRKIVNSDPSRIAAIHKLMGKHGKLIVFYNFIYERDILRQLKEDPDFEFAEYNGEKHDPIPESNKWVYIVQYTAGAEGWNCIETNAIAFYSLNYSYRTTIQSAGRIDRMNTPFETLYYYQLRSTSKIDNAIMKALRNKETFNEKNAKLQGPAGFSVVNDEP